MNSKCQRKSSDKYTRIVESVFYRFKEIEKAIKDARLDCRCHGRNGHKWISDPTASAAIDRATELPSVVLSDGSEVPYPERWVKVVKATYTHLDSLQQKVFVIRYIKRLSWKECASLNISRDTFYNLLNDAVMFAKLAACQLGVMRVIE
ncbi:hypothetical protein [uncultured Megasphaera sp.]|uniref:hypothetical protein n=1 Tax=uncultured Megasphaera sp. TaxID=165188 RepID=UPI00262C2371|nr:hypothetical protein [uncultured Megasphaera sp.]